MWWQLSYLQMTKFDFRLCFGWQSYSLPALFFKSRTVCSLGEKKPPFMCWGQWCVIGGRLPVLPGLGCPSARGAADEVFGLGFNFSSVFCLKADLAKLPNLSHL